MNATENLEAGFEKNSSLIIGIGFESHYPTS